MKYIRNSTRIKPLELCDESGNVVLTVGVLTDYLAMKKRLEAAAGDIRKAQETKNPEEIGRCVCAMIATVYGEDNMKRIVDFFEHDYSDMITAVYQHLNADVYPELRRLAKERKKQLRHKLTPFR